jgi:hypothetical protein
VKTGTCGGMIGGKSASQRETKAGVWSVSKRTYREGVWFQRVRAGQLGGFVVGFFGNLDLEITDGLKLLGFFGRGFPDISSECEDASRVAGTDVEGHLQPLPSD